MSKHKGLLKEKDRKDAIDNIIDFFSRERDEEIGVIAAEEILDFCLDLFGKKIYNSGAQDAANFIRDRLGEIVLDTEINIQKPQ